MRDIPKTIRDRCTFAITDGIRRITEIKPARPTCEDCGNSIDKARYTEVYHCTKPFAHYREKCKLCRRARMTGDPRWSENTRVLNELLKTKRFLEDK